MELQHPTQLIPLLFLLGYLLAAAISTGFTIYILKYRSEQPGALAFGAIAACLAIWAVGYVGRLFMGTLDGVTSTSVSVTVEPGEVDAVEIDPATDANRTIEAGDQFAFNATARDGFGNIVESNDTAFTWDNTTDAGTFENTTAGTYEVTATFDGVASSPVLLTVEPGPVASVEVDPVDNQTLEAGATIAFNATALDTFGNTVTDDNNAVTWQNASPDGTFEETTAGTYAVVATFDGIVSESIAVTVEPSTVETVDIDPAGDRTIIPGVTIGFNATAYDAFDNVVEVDDAAFTWQNTTDAGTFDTTTAGTYIVTAELDGVTSSSVSVSVESASVETVELSPVDDQIMTAGETVAFNATAYDGFGNRITADNTAFTWEHASANGTVDRTTADTVDVIATLGGVDSEPVSVTVEPAEVERVEIAPVSDRTINTGEVIAFNATAFDGYENVVDDVAVTWQNATDDGTFVGDDSGNFTISASADGIESRQVNVTVRSPATFTASIDATPVDVDEGEVVAVEATITNVGDLADTQVVTLEDFDGELVDSTEVTLGGGEAQSVTLEWETTPGDAGEGALTVRTENESTSTDEVAVLEVLEPADFTITGVGVPGEPELGVEETVSLDLEGGETATVTFEDLSIDDPGTYTVEVSSPDEELAESMTVQADEGVDDVDDEDDADEGQPGFGIVVAVIALMIAGISAARHRSH